MKKCLSILLTLALAVGCLLPSAFAEQKVDLTGKLVIVYTNDVHGYAVTDPSEPAAGYAQVAQYKKDAAALLAGERVHKDKIYSDKTGKTYAADMVLEDTGEITRYRLVFDNA